MRPIKKSATGAMKPIRSGRKLRRGAMEMFPALESLGRIRVKVDKGFTDEATGVGNIEYFSPGTPEIPYPTGNVFDNPGLDRRRAILVGPKAADPQSVALDMLHALPEVDPKYNQLLQEFGESLNDEEIRYWYNDAKKEGWWDDGWGGYEQYKKNYVDGKLRNLLFEGTEEDFERSRYNPTERDLVKEHEPAAFEKFQEIQTYLKTPKKA